MLHDKVSVAAIVVPVVVVVALCYASWLLFAYWPRLKHEWLTLRIDALKRRCFLLLYLLSSDVCIVHLPAHVLQGLLGCLGDKAVAGGLVSAPCSSRFCCLEDLPSLSSWSSGYDLHHLQHSYQSMRSAQESELLHNLHCSDYSLHA